MSASVARVIDLEDYRRRRTTKTQSTAAVSLPLVWVPVWVWMPVWPAI